jgi:hypothetical protein
LIRRLQVTKTKIGTHLNNYTMYNTYYYIIILFSANISTHRDLTFVH